MATDPNAELAARLRSGADLLERKVSLSVALKDIKEQLVEVDRAIAEWNGDSDDDDAAVDKK